MNSKSLQLSSNLLRKLVLYPTELRGLTCSVVLDLTATITKNLPESPAISFIVPRLPANSRGKHGEAAP